MMSEDEYQRQSLEYLAKVVKYTYMMAEQLESIRGEIFQIKEAITDLIKATK
jgi:hypothetical protein